MTIEAFYSACKFSLIAGASGFWFTLGMWAFCKGFGWAPVNINVNTNGASVEVVKTAR